MEVRMSKIEPWERQKDETAMAFDAFRTLRKWSPTASEVFDYFSSGQDCRRDEAGQIVKTNDHFMDAMRYTIFSEVQRGIVFLW